MGTISLHLGGETVLKLYWCDVGKRWSWQVGVPIVFVVGGDAAFWESAASVPQSGGQREQSENLIQSCDVHGIDSLFFEEVRSSS
ncbi:hypothetical protein [Bradyrhizobium mercantei]|uniref:hypothetical protein n=1 Tax=Bradyrhizobium mercantei TaxID=1904807 RepID=UPI001177729B|nr:hypothetical protein [Bradyrhizobium mercantei]